MHSPPDAPLHPEHQAATQAAEPLERCAAGIVAVVPLLMREIRGEMRRAAPAGLSVPLFRTLIYARSQPGASLSALAAHLGVTLPTASVGVDKLMAQGLLQTGAQQLRLPHRRALHLTPEGERIVRAAMAHTTSAFMRRLQGLPPETLDLLQQALAVLDTRIAHPVAPAADSPSCPAS
ncbi:MAG: hypothetical protein RJA44_321 [Pseudomonadota bacterium]